MAIDLTHYPPFASVDTEAEKDSTSVGWSNGTVVAVGATGKIYVRAANAWTERGGGGSASQAFPVGSVFIAVVSTNPATLLGYGTWSAFGAGRVMVGIDAGDIDFANAEQTGGAKTHTLTEAEIPSHTHVQNQHRHQTLRERSATTGGATTQIARTGDTSSTVDTNVFTEYATPTNQNTGGGGAHNNMPPYICVFLWKRTS